MKRELRLSRFDTEREYEHLERERERKESEMGNPPGVPGDDGDRPGFDLVVVLENTEGLSISEFAQFARVADQLARHAFREESFAIVGALGVEGVNLAPVLTAIDRRANTKPVPARLRDVERGSWHILSSIEPQHVVVFFSGVLGGIALEQFSAAFSATESGKALHRLLTSEINFRRTADTIGSRAAELSRRAGVRLRKVTRTAVGARIRVQVVLEAGDKVIDEVKFDVALDDLIRRLRG